MTTKLFERLVTKFSIKVADLIKYLEISKATIYNYRNLEKFSDIPKDKQYKIFYLFGKETEEELELVLDESDPDILAQYVNRISSILRESIQDKKQAIASVEDLTNTVEHLRRENTDLQHQVSSMQALAGIDPLTRAVLLDKVASIANGATVYDTIEFTMQTESIQLPVIPYKDGFVIVGWDITEFPTSNQVVNAVYTQI